MTHFFRSGSQITIAEDRHGNIMEKLPAGNYLVKFSPLIGFYLEETNGFDLPPKFYGKLVSHAKRMLTTFNSRQNSTGVLLSGEKGSGKSLLAKKIAQDSLLPVLIVNQPYGGDLFSGFLASINQPCVVFFDEFEKTYQNDGYSYARRNEDGDLIVGDAKNQPVSGYKQSALLTLLDGVFSQKKLYLLTCNDSYEIHKHMKNRPGRLFYFLEFGGLEPDFIKEYCEESLSPSNQKRIPEIVAFAGLFDAFNFDMLKALVEELNRFDCSVEDCAEVLNIKPRDRGGRYDIEIFTPDGKPCALVNPNQCTGNPLTGAANTNLPGASSGKFQINIMREMPQGGKKARDFIEGGPRGWEAITFSVNDLKDSDPYLGKLTFINKDGWRAEFLREKTRVYRYAGDFSGF